MTGFIAFLIVVGFPCLCLYGGWRIAAKYGPGIMARQRDQKIEVALRIRIRDAEAIERISAKILDECDE